jgi:hypothetical protein
VGDQAGCPRKHQVVGDKTLGRIFNVIGQTKMMVNQFPNLNDRLFTGKRLLWKNKAVNQKCWKVLYWSVFEEDVRKMIIKPLSISQSHDPLAVNQP